MFPLAFLILPRGATLGMDPGVLFRLGYEYPEPYCSSDQKYVFRRCFLELSLVTGGNCCIYYFAGIEMAPNGLSNIGAAPGAFCCHA